MESQRKSQPFYPSDMPAFGDPEQNDQGRAKVLTNTLCFVGNFKPHCHSVALSVKTGYQNTDYSNAKELQSNV